jgi:carbamoyl-phosphate synthase small subunit
VLGKLALEDGYVVTGQAFGAPGQAWGEVVFNTSMTGYQEILTDPSYCGQLIVMTYPLIGNYGVAELDCEAPHPYARGLIVRELCQSPSNWRHESTLESFLKRHRLMGLCGVDTRSLVRRIRDRGAMRGVMAAGPSDDAELVARARSAPALTGQPLVAMVSPRRPAEHNAEGWPTVVLVDMGSKAGILRELIRRGFRVWTVPYDWPADEIMALGPAGIVLSNGPGDPVDARPAALATAGLIGRLPVMGICLGHQVLGMAVGARTYKLKFGHRGANHPVLEHRSGRTYITAQNHGFAVDAAGLPGEFAVSHTNLNDGTVEGLEHRRLPVFSVQYHPEASPGPRDSAYLFDRFAAAVRDGRCAGA